MGANRPSAIFHLSLPAHNGEMAAAAVTRERIGAVYEFHAIAAAKLAPRQWLRDRLVMRDPESPDAATASGRAHDVRDVF